MQFLVDILPLGSGSVDPHIFADPDPDPVSQNLADPMDPDLSTAFKYIFHSRINKSSQPSIEDDSHGWMRPEMCVGQICLALGVVFYI